ncbi:MAG: exodeoxyribonuclease VII large subunit [Akkermansia sp.]
MQDSPQSVSSLLSQLKMAVERYVGEQSVIGEIGSCKAAGSGHVYFTLKDDKSQLQCVLYRYQAASCRVQLREGIQVELRGRATVWEGRGSLQFIVSAVKLAGQGSLQQQFEALKNKLASEGLFSPERKKAIPAWPSSVGLITSATGAVIEDMRHRLESRAPWMNAYLLPVQVQGLGAEFGIARAIEAWSQPSLRQSYQLPEVDYLIIARGGGSMEDLWCFNAEVLARAIADCPLPIISAVGHETDFTIADFVADMRAPTPTAAIELSTPDGESLDAWLEQCGIDLRRRLSRELQNAHLRLRVAEQSRLRSPQEILAPFGQRVDDLEARFTQSYQQRLQHAHHQLELMAARLSTRSTLQGLHERREQLSYMEAKLKQQVQTKLQQGQAKLETLSARLQAASPQNALDRGFALVQSEDGKLIRQASALQQGEKLRVSLAQGSLSVQVTDQDAQRNVLSK